jgi:integrase
MDAPLRIASESRQRGQTLRFAFTEARLRALRPPVERSELYVRDSEVRGLVYRISRNDHRAFYLYVKDRGRPVKVKIGGGYLAVADARKLARERLTERDRGGDLLAKRRATREVETIGSMWDAYRVGFLETRATPKTAETWVSLWNVWLAPWASRRADQVAPEDVVELHAKIGKGRIAGADESKPGRRLGGPRTANKAVALLRRIYNYSRVENPVKPGTVELFRQHSRERYLTPPELKRFFAALATEPDQTIADFILLALFTGARRANLQSMRWDEIDLDAEQWTIPAEKFKTRRAVTIALPPAAVAILKARQQLNAMRAVPSPWVLASNRSAAGHLVEPKTAFKRICREAKLKDLRIHDLRRTMGSWMAGLGTSLPVIGKALGHASQAATAIYSRISLDPVRESVNGAVDAMLLAAGVTPKPAAQNERRTPRKGRKEKKAGKTRKKS